ncbi:hypothetical protein JET18_12310 [Chryseobacterium sp. L7]|uniref:SMODS-associating 2TM beta-strand rich effector domain-containing protein n=1 Tax=Chryseobacterium endalhagicum TaxID=2797638 RepID=A0ABS1QGB2_9FLAO|nr:hypothetical protein [Chryseobacterium endalhagicum]MBL1221626.1 hypothetical protein [Chryseobacterium endalhagicum]
MTRKFTEVEKNILYKNIPLQKQGHAVGWETVLFIILTILMFGFGIKIILFDYNPFFDDEKETLGSFLYFMAAFIPIGAGSFVSVAVLFMLVKNMILYPKYGKYAVEKSFDVAEIEIIQGKGSEDFIIRIFNTGCGKTEIKIDLKIAVESSLKDNFLNEIEKYRVKDSENIHIPFMKVLHILETKPFSGMVYLKLSDFSTDTKLDSSQLIYSYDVFFKTKYNVVSSLKTKEPLFINFYGDHFEKEINFTMNDVESKITYYFIEDHLL